MFAISTFTTIRRHTRKLTACAAAALLCSLTFAGQPWVNGDVFVGVANGQYFVYSNAGAFKQSINSGLGSFTTGGSFNSDFSRLFTTSFGAGRVTVYDGVAPHAVLQQIDTTLHGGGSPESIVFDSSGFFYVGHAAGDRNIQKYDSLGNFVASYDVATENVGSDWIDLAADQRTMFHTSEGRRIMRYDLQTSTQLTDFTVLPGVGEAFAFRLLPPFDGTGGLLVADDRNIKRLDGSGAVVQTYDPNGAAQNGWFALNLDPNGTSFWAASFESSNFYRINIASGAVEVGPINTGTGTDTVYGLIVRGEITGGNNPPEFIPPSVCGTTLGASVGAPFTVTFAARDINPGDIVTLTASGVPSGATFSPSLPTMGNPVSSTLGWTPSSSDTGTHTVIVTATDISGNQTTCNVTINVAECHFLIGRGGGSQQVTLFGHQYDTQLASVRMTWPVTMLDRPSLRVPMHLSSPLHFSCQTLMYNPVVFPTNPSQWSNRLRVTIHPGGIVTSELLGTLNGIHQSVTTYVDTYGTLMMTFPFTIDGM